ncbi:DUF29 family protein [Pleurocapsales cyanobacterium LEGE 06147]|nr:DUF29 family protein [Pleurocapsales cyanobacterium LEGE 06147]
MTQELIELREAILRQDTQAALEIVQELETMGREDKIINIESYLVILLVHLLKIQIEKRITNSWRSSILNSLLRIQRLNKMGNKKTPYIKAREWENYLREVLPEVYLKASSEINEGAYSDEELEQLADEEKLIEETVSLLDLTFDRSPDILKKLASQALRQF